MSSANPLPETCHVYLDLSPLPLQSDDSADLVALSPFTITWGVSNPWDDITPNVLKITLIDQADRFSKSATCSWATGSPSHPTGGTQPHR